MGSAMQFIIDTRPANRPKIIFINLQRIADMTGYSRSHMSRVFSRKTNPSFSCLMAIAEALGLKIDDTAQRIANRKFKVRRENEKDKNVDGTQKPENTSCI
jgi:transcriptional regulator with XRE-family HTH domain